MGLGDTNGTETRMLHRTKQNIELKPIKKPHLSVEKNTTLEFNHNRETIEDLESKLSPWKKTELKTFSQDSWKCKS